MRKFLISSLVAAAAVTTVPAKAADPRQWTPTGPWQLDATADQCTLLRRFKAGEDELLLQVQPNVYSTAHNFTLASATALRNIRADTIDFTLAEEKERRPLYGWVETLVGGGQPVLRWMTDNSLHLADVVRDDETVRIKSNWGFDGTLTLPGAKKAFQALRKCQDEVAKDKGLDAVARRAYKRQVTPLGNPGRWVTNDDYPARARGNRQEGMTGFRVTIDKAGLVTACDITTSSGFPVLDERTCELVTSRARFLPALDATGAPVADSYSNRVRWAIPR